MILLSKLWLNCHRHSWARLEMVATAMGTEVEVAALMVTMASKRSLRWSVTDNYYAACAQLSGNLHVSPVTCVDCLYMPVCMLHLSKW